MRDAWWSWRSRAGNGPTTEAPVGAPDRHLELARESLRGLLEDRRVPTTVREALVEDYAAVAAMLDKLERGHLHIAAVGRVSVGKSSLLNALVGEERFAVSPVHGSTGRSTMTSLEESEIGGVFVIDTPGLNEVAGEERERLAHEVAARADLVLFVADSDLTASEVEALGTIADARRPVLLVLNKADRYTQADRELLVQSVASKAAGVVERGNIVTAAARPAARPYVERDAEGRETETRRQPPADIGAVRERLWEILEAEGKTLAALNAGLFAASLSDQVGERSLAARHAIGERGVRLYCVAKGVAVALNPIPVADLFAVAFIDVTMIVHLSRVYGLPLSRMEAGAVIRTAMTEMAALMGTVWAMHLVSSALKLGTAGTSTLLTAGAQGAVAYYSTYVVGRVVERYLALGKSWGPAGPKTVVREILDSLDRDSILAQGRADIRAHLRARTGGAA